MSRIAASDPTVWRGILATNRRRAVRALEDFIRELRRLRRVLPAGAAGEFRRAARARARLVG
jgi:prephenate dehydrogenase